MRLARARWGVAVVVVSLAALLVACPNGRDDGGEPRRGGVLRVGLVRPDSLDPVQADTVDELWLADQLFDSLTTWDPKTGAPKAGLATRWTATPDQQHWDFFLRES